MNLKFSNIVFLFLILTMCMCAFAESGIIAIVNTEAITQGDLDDFINFMRVQMSATHSEQNIEQRIKQMLPDLINRLIEDRLILQAAYKEGINIYQIRIKARLEQIRRNYPTEADFQSELVSQGLSLADLELKIKEQLMMTEIIDRKIKSDIEVKPWEVTDYYNANSKELKTPERRRVKSIIVKDPDIAEQIQKSISKYKDLDTIAKEYSLEITDLDWVTVEQLKKEIADAVFNLGVGKLSALLDSEKNFYVFEVSAIKLPAPIPLFEIQEKITRILFERKMQEALVEWLEELKSEAYIKIQGDDEGS